MLTVEKGEEVDLIVSHITEIGINVIINERHKGLLYKDEVYDDAIRTGDRMRGYIKNIRPDNKIDVSLQIQGYQNIEPKHNTRIEFFEVHWFIDHALEVYEKSKRKCLIKKIKLEIVYVNVEGKKFSKILPFEVEGLLSYKQSEMNK